MEISYFEQIDWDTAEKIEMLNERDADYNNISLEELNELLKEDVSL